MNDNNRYMSPADSNQFLDALDIGHPATGAIPELSDGLHLTAASTIEPETPLWLWDGRIPLKSITLLIGSGGLGKTTLACDVAARVSRGQLGRPPTAVLFATTEDSLSHTLVPRLLAAGADLERVHFVTIVEGGFENGLTLPDNLDALEAAITDKEAALVILDPLVGTLSSTIDSHRDHSVRRVLGPLHALAEATGVSLLGVAHLNKSGSTNPLARLGGSVAFGNAARSVLLFASDPNNDESPERYLVHVKSNLSKLAPALRFQIEPRTVQDRTGADIATSGLAWLGEINVEARDLLSPSDPDNDRPERDIARAVLLDALTQTDSRWADLVRLTKAEGVSEHTSRRARGELRGEGLIETRKDGLKGGWTWKLVTNLPTHKPWASSKLSGQLREKDSPLSSEEVAAEPVAEPGNTVTSLTTNSSDK